MPNRTSLPFPEDWYGPSQQIPLQPQSSPGVTRRWAPGVAPYLARRRGQQQLDPTRMAGSLYRDYTSAFEEARRANEQRYQDILTGHQKRESEAMATLEGMGETERGDIRGAYRSRESQMMQNLAARGMAGTTIAPTMRMGLQREQTRELGALDERLRGQRLGYQTGLSGERLGFMERREDEYPDIRNITELMGALGQTGAFGGGGGGLGGLAGLGGGTPGRRYGPTAAQTPSLQAAPAQQGGFLARPSTSTTTGQPVSNLALLAQAESARRRRMTPWAQSQAFRRPQGTAPYNPMA
jgi:hypothetical protein